MIARAFVFVVGLCVLGAVPGAASKEKPGPAHAWTRTYGGRESDEGYSVLQTRDSGFVVAGYTWSSGAGMSDVYLIRTDAAGDTLWTRTFGGTKEDYGSSVCQAADDGFVITGSSGSIMVDGGDVCLIRTNAKGETLWTRTYGGRWPDRGSSVQQTAGGGYIITGQTRSFGAGWDDVYLIRTNANGETLWTRTCGGTNSDQGRSVAQTSDGGFIVAGSTNSSGAGGIDLYLIRNNASGDTLWTRTYGGANWDLGSSVAQTNDGGFIVAGYTASFGAGGYDVWLIRTDAKGDTLWTRTFGGRADDRGNSVQQTADWGYVVAGETQSFGGKGNNVYVIRTGSRGDTLWTRTYGGTAGDMGYSVLQTRDSGFVVAGTTASSGKGETDVYLIRTDSLGKVSK